MRPLVKEMESNDQIESFVCVTAHRRENLGKPVLVLREETKRPEAINAGTVKLVGLDKSNIKKRGKSFTSKPG